MINQLKLPTNFNLIVENKCRLFCLTNFKLIVENESTQYFVQAYTTIPNVYKFFMHIGDDTGNQITEFLPLGPTTLSMTMNCTSFL